MEDQTKLLSVYTVGHSTLSLERFIELLNLNGVTAIADVRSAPFSRLAPQFNRNALSGVLRKCGIAYVFVGKELGARSDDASCYEGGKVRFARLAKTSIFNAGLDRILTGAVKYRVALMCSEKEPLDCHRTLLVSRALEQRGVNMIHILSDGRTESHSKTMFRLLDLVGLPQVDIFGMFPSHDHMVTMACELQEEKIAYVDEALVEK